ncbi:MAG: hypothetical protein ACRCR6_05995 [Plesiomonas sp.]
MQKWRTGLAAVMVMWSGMMAPGHAAESARMFPIWGDEAKAAGYEIPEPFGLNISHMQVKQGIQVDSIAFSGLSPRIAISPRLSAENIKLMPTVRETKQRSDTSTLRADMWVFPFLNVYGLVGKTEGRTDSLLDMQIALDVKLNKLSIPVQIPLENIHFPLEFHGDTFGLGFVLAGGYGNWFALTDVSYTQTKMDILDGKIDALVASPRVGYQFSVWDRPLRVWAGGMYQSIDQSFSGNIADLSLPANLKQMLLLVDPNKSGKFHVEQHLESPWNTLLGAQYQITPTLLLLTEWGLGQRTSAFFTLDMRF